MHSQNGHAQAGARVHNAILSAPNSAIVREIMTNVRTRNPLELENMKKRSTVRNNDSCVHTCMWLELHNVVLKQQKLMFDRYLHNM